MSIPIWSEPVGMVSIPGSVAIRNFDLGIMAGLSAVPFADATHPCFSVPVLQPNGSTQNVNTYFDQPEAIFKLKVYPFITVHREIDLAMHRWMGIGQLEYRSGVSGTQVMINGVSGYSQHQSKIQAFPYDFTYTISCFDRYEQGAQVLISYLLKHFPPLGKLIVFDSLGLQRSYEAYLEGSVANLQELIDPVNRVRGYAITVRVEGELDLADPYSIPAVSGFELFLHRQDVIT